MQVVELFRKILSIPHCSADTQALREFIRDFARSYGFAVQEDRAGNLLCFKERRSIALQAHYDMVCVGAAPNIEIVEKDGWLCAKDSSLGADNGIGVAMMLALMSEGFEAEYLFTNDEEIGLVGAKALELQLEAKRMINLDSEEFGSIFVGCAGGVDIYGQKELTYEEQDGPFWRVRVRSQGGHSGVDIDKEIPNAIKELAYYLADHGAKIAKIQGGERINSIPAYAEAIVCGELRAKDGFELEPIEAIPIIKESEQVLELLLALPHGVRGWERELEIPLHSQNLALVTTQDRLRIAVSARSMNKVGLYRLELENVVLLKAFGCEVHTEGRYDPWEPRIGEFAKEFAQHYAKTAPGVRFKAIHAGLEAAVLAQKFPYMQIISIGPDIQAPHSTLERVRLESVEALYRVVREYLCACS